MNKAIKLVVVSVVALVLTGSALAFNLRPQVHIGYAVQHNNTKKAPRHLSFCIPCIIPSASAINAAVNSGTAVWQINPWLNPFEEDQGVCNSHGGIIYIDSFQGQPTPDGIPLVIHIIHCGDGSSVVVTEEGIQSEWWNSYYQPAYDPGSGGGGENGDGGSGGGDGGSYPDCEAFWADPSSYPDAPGGC